LEAPKWETPHAHQDCGVFDMTASVGNATLVDNGFLMALRDTQVSARQPDMVGDPIGLFECFVE
jgi:hypothetical protein